MRLAWVDRINGTINAGLSRPWVRSLLFKNYLTLFLAMVTIVGRCQLPITLTLIALGMASDLLRRKVFFKPSNSIESYFEYERIAQSDQNMANKMRGLFYAATLPFCVIVSVSLYVSLSSRYFFSLNSIYYMEILSNMSDVKYFLPGISLSHAGNNISWTEIRGPVSTVLFIVSYFYLSVFYVIISNIFFPQYFLASLNRVTFDYERNKRSKYGGAFSYLFHAYIKKNKIGSLGVSLLMLFVSLSLLTGHYAKTTNPIIFLHSALNQCGQILFFFACYLFFMIFVYFVAFSHLRNS